MTAVAPEPVKRKTSRWVVAGAAAILVILLAAPATIVLLLRDDGGPQAMRIAALPTDVAVLGDTVWVASGREDRVIALEAGEPDRFERHATGSAPLRVAVGAGSVWTANAGDDSVTRLNPLIPGSVGRRIAIGSDAVDAAVGPDGAWVSNGQRGTVTRIDAISNRVLGDPVRTGEFPTALAIGANHLWVVNSGDGTVARVDPRENVVVGRRLPVGRDPQDIAVGFDSVWVANRGDGTLTRLSAADGRPQGPSIRVGGAPGALAITQDAVLVLDTNTGAVLRVDPKTLAAAEILRIPGYPAAIAVGAGRPGSSTRAAAPLHECLTSRTNYVLCGFSRGRSGGEREARGLEVQLKVSGTGRRVVAAAGVVAVATAGAVIARADDQSARSAQAAGGLAVSPATIERAAATGVANAVTVTNNSREALTITVKARPWTQSSSGLASPNRRRALAGVTVSNGSFTLAPGAKQELTVTLGGAPAGGSLYGALEVVGLPRNAATRKGVVTGYRIIGALRYNPATPTYTLTASAAKVSKGSIVLPVRSTGNTAQPVTGTVRVRGPLGTDQGSIKSTRILPGKRVSLALVSTRGLSAGTYTATVSLRQGGKRFDVSKRITVRR